jgi:hypothetical protein
MSVLKVGVYYTVKICFSGKMWVDLSDYWVTSCNQEERKIKK